MLPPISLNATCFLRYNLYLTEKYRTNYASYNDSEQAYLILLSLDKLS
jgi:hypothetical protein